LAAATAICSYVQVVILVVVLRRRLGPQILNGLLVGFIKTVVATAFMSLVGVLIMIAMRGLPTDRLFNILRVGVVVLSAATAYLLIARVLRIEMLSLFTGGKGRVQ